MHQFYRLIFITFLTIAGVSTAKAQDLINSRRTSYHTFIFKLTNEQAHVLYKNMWDLDNSFVQNLHDFYPTDSIYKKQLPVGHYLFVHANEGELRYKLESVNNLDIKLLNNHRDLIMVVHDSIGHELKDPNIKIRSRNVRYENTTKTYRLKKTNKKGIIQVLYRGHVSYFEFGRRHNNGFLLRTSKKILNTVPLNHILSPLFYLKNNVINVVHGGRISAPGIYYRVKRMFGPRQFTGYVAFNKPEYRPGDTLKLKAFVTSRKGDPFRRPVVVYLQKNYAGMINKKISTVSPFRKGAYKFELVLSDSLDLALDSDYSIELQTKKGHYLLSSGFRYEEYELKQNKYFVRSENKTGRLAELYLKGVDSNERPLHDARFEILLRPKQVKKYFQPEVFVPDTLWFHQSTMESVAETKILLPDSLFPSVEMEYEAVVSFLNTENERTVKTTVLEFDQKPFPVQIDLKNDSLLISATNDGFRFREKIKLETFDASGKLQTKMVNVPHREKLNYFAEGYSIDYAGESSSIRLGAQSNDLEILATRSADSLFIVTENPRKISFRYFLFRNRKLMEQSEAVSLLLKRKVNSRDHYSLSVQFVWGGEAQSRDYDIRFDDRNLDIKLEHPALVYPGQTSKFTISVNDAAGNPVKDVDLTTFSITKKFALPRASSVPNLAKPARERSIFNEFDRRETDLSFSKALEFAYWRKVLGLDSIAFYSFLFPDSGYYEHRAAARVAQISPFVIGGVIGVNRALDPAQVIYVDGQPVYYRGTNTIEPYSFALKPGVHTITLRLRNYLIRMSGVRVDSAQKLILSVDRSRLPSNCSIVKMPYRFTDEELLKLSRYFILVRSHGSPVNAYVHQGDRYHLFGRQGHRNGDLAGPFYPGRATYFQKDGFKTHFDYEPFYTHEFSENLLKLREANITNQLKGGFGWEREVASFKDHVHTVESIEDYWKRLEAETPTPRRFERFPESTPDARNAGRLTLEGKPKAADGLSVKATFIVNLDHPDEYFVLPGSIHNELFNTGHYQAVLVFSDEQYLKADSIFVRPHGINYHYLGDKKIHPADSMSKEVLRMIRTWAVPENYTEFERRKALQNIRSLYYDQAFSDFDFDHAVAGRIIDEDGLPLPGVNVVVQGSPMGTVTDIDGYYRLKCPDNATLVFSFIGYQTVEAAVQARNEIDIKLQADVQMLREVVVVGFGTQARKMLTGSVQTIRSGRVAGVLVHRYAVSSDSVALQIRGLTSIVGASEPLVILDGVVVRLPEVDKSRITAIEVLKGSQATAIYGSRASNGVILMSTRAGATKAYLKEMSKPLMQSALLEEIPGSSLRKNFRDYAFWKPDLITDENGKAVFEVTFPDDITGWNAYVLGMGSKRRTGQTSSVIQSYKPLMAQIFQPHFLIEGDRATGMGKITHYGQEKIRLERTITVNDVEITKGAVEIENSRIDSIRLLTEDADSLAVKYTVAYNDYVDGELRKIPVYRKGVMETAGLFVAMEGDTAFTLNMNNTEGQVKIYAQADLIDVLLDEIGFLKNYPYQCNEQLASRLRALVLEKKIHQFRKTKFKYERDLEKTLRKLVAHQNKDGSWSWWQTGEGDIWLTLHAARSLFMAEHEGYRTSIDKEKLINYLEGSLSNLEKSDKLSAMQFLLELGQLVIVDEAIALRNSRKPTVHERLLAERLKQLSGKKVNWDTIDSLRRETIKGNYYWAEEKENVRDNSILNTLLVFQMGVAEKRPLKELSRIRNYFLEKRRKTWRNTYESSLILETVLPQLMKEGPVLEKTTLTLEGSADRKIQNFPYEFVGTNIGELRVSKTGKSPLYFTVYSEKWNSKPLKVEKDFIVSTFFENGSEKLRAGKPVRLNVRVEVKRDAEYVMIEVPVPAGCSYAEKTQSRRNGEVHREFFNHKTSIFCEYMKKGIYEYHIELLPRYSGKYTLNPAVVECMYFPTLFGREEVKQVEVK